MNAYCTHCRNTQLHEGGNRTAICDSCGRVYYLHIVDQSPDVKLLGGCAALAFASVITGLAFAFGFAVLRAYGYV